MEKFFAMFVLLGFTALLVPFAVSKMPEGARNIRGHGLRIRNLKAQIRSENGRAAFPHDIEGVLEIAGLPKKNMKAKLLKGDRSPSVLEVNGKSKKKMTPEKKETAYYVGPDVSFATTARKQQGKYEAEMFGVVREGNQNCIWKNNRKAGTRAFCSEVAPGNDVTLDPITGKSVTRTRRKRSSEILAGRKRRQIVEPSDQIKVIKNVVFCAKGFMDRFKAINDGDYDQAVADIYEYVILLTNEWTYGFQTLLARPGGFDLAIHTVEFIFPPDGEDFEFIRKDSQGVIQVETISHFGQDSVVRQKTDYGVGIAHHASLLVGDPIGPGILGVAYFGSICRPYVNGYRVDIIRDLDWNGAIVGVHEIGHSMGAGHDGLDNSCDTASYLMAAYAFSPTESNKDTAFTFSHCSADDITEHIMLYDPIGTCLAGKYEDFVSDFCLGPRGRTGYISLDEQCEMAATGYTICGDISKVTADQCWQYDSVECCNGGSRIKIKHISEGTPCFGSDPLQTSYCHLGRCEPGDAICSTSKTTTTAA